jgi:S-(hydroxymethyl)glutathione dehydrogenase/alcohol dehydrogenase
VGLSAVQGARIAGAGPIIAIDRVEEKLELAEGLGATQTIDAGTDDVAARVLELTGGLGVRHAIEAVGTSATAELAFSILRRGGAATIVGLIPLGHDVSIPGDQLLYEKTLQGSFMGSNRFRIDVPRYVDMYRDGRLNLDDMVTARLSLSEINDGFAMMERGKSARTVVVFDHSG